MRLTDLLTLSIVPRWSIVPHLREQSVADHTFRVAIIYLELCDRMAHPLDIATLLFILRHDGAESRTGDIPGNFKRRIVAELDRRRGNLTELELDVCPWLAEDHIGEHSIAAAIVKIADLIETYTFIKMWGRGEFAIRVADRVFRQLHEYVAASFFAPSFGIIDDICRDIIAETGRDI